MLRLILQSVKSIRLKGTLASHRWSVPIYTLTMFGRDRVTERQRITIDVQPRQREKPKSEVPKKRDKSSPTPGPRVRESSAGTRGVPPRKGSGVRCRSGAVRLASESRSVLAPVRPLLRQGHALRCKSGSDVGSTPDRP